MSSYGGSKDYNMPPVNRISSTSSRQQLKKHPKVTYSFREIGNVSNRHTPKSKDRREQASQSFIVHDHPNLIRQESKTGTSVAEDIQPVQIDEEEEKKLILENPMRKRVFVHIAQTSTSVQVAWTHANKTKTGKRIHYLLEYGVGIKMNGEEQFRTIYKGKAHKCIITDLMPRTAYRFKVIPFRLDENGEEEFGETSEIKQINTYDYQDIHPSTLGHHANIIMKKQEKWINFEKQGLIMAQYGYSYGVQMWKVTIS
jgi:hypothetical protein